LEVVKLLVARGAEIDATAVRIFFLANQMGELKGLTFFYFIYLSCELDGNIWGEKKGVPFLFCEQ